MEHLVDHAQWRGYPHDVLAGLANLRLERLLSRGLRVGRAGHDRKRRRRQEGNHSSCRHQSISIIKTRPKELESIGRKHRLMADVLGLWFAPAILALVPALFRLRHGPTRERSQVLVVLRSIVRRHLRVLDSPDGGAVADAVRRAGLGRTAPPRHCAGVLERTAHHSVEMAAREARTNVPRDLPARGNSRSLRL